MVSVGFRTLLRGFMIFGGVAFAVSGALAGSAIEVGFGLFAALLGGFGLWRDARDPSSEA